MNNLQNKIKDKIFLVTSELNPPKGTDLSTLFNKVELLKKSMKGGKGDKVSMTLTLAALKKECKSNKSNKSNKMVY